MRYVFQSPLMTWITRVTAHSRLTTLKPLSSTYDKIDQVHNMDSNYSDSTIKRDMEMIHKSYNQDNVMNTWLGTGAVSVAAIGAGGVIAAVPALAENKLSQGPLQLYKHLLKSYHIGHSCASIAMHWLKIHCLRIQRNFIIIC